MKQRQAALFVFALSCGCSLGAESSDNACSSVGTLQCLDVDGSSCDSLKSSCDSFDIPFKGEFLPPPTVTPPQDDCRYLEIFGLPPNDIQISTMGLYERTGESNSNKPVFKQIGGSHYLFAFNPSLWVVGGVVGVDDGKVLVWDGAVEPRHIKAPWQAYNGKEWDFVSTLGCKCKASYEIDWAAVNQRLNSKPSTLAPPKQPAGAPCEHVLLVGHSDGEVHHAMMGTYHLRPDLSNNGRPVWTQVASLTGVPPSATYNIFSILAQEKSAWVVGAVVGKDDAGLVAWDESMDAVTITTTWKYWDTTEWVDDPRIRLQCVDRAHAVDPTPQSPLPFGLCDRVFVGGLGTGDMHHFMMGAYSAHSRPSGGKIAFKQEDGDQHLFSLMDGRVWAVGSKLGVDDVGILVWDTATHPIHIKREWQMWNGHKWVTQPRINVKCAS